MTERRLFVPPEYVEGEKPVIFLAGPIQGAPDWQSEAIELIHENNPQITIASPRRASLEEEDFNYNEQVNWETAHLRKAARDGVIIFWLARETEHHPDRAYAQTSRIELGEWKVIHQRAGAHLVVGIEEGFSGAKYIRHRFSQDCSDVPILDSLEETCRTALELLDSSDYLLSFAEVNELCQKSISITQ